MTISTSIKKNNIVVGNVYSIEEADVVLLLEDHETKKYFDKIERIIHDHFNVKKDLILLEHPKGSSRDHLLNQEQKLGSWRVKILENKNIAGWDHPLGEQWAKEYYQNPDVKDFTQAVDVLENLRESDSCQKVLNSFATLVRGVRHLEGDQALLPSTEYEPLVKNKAYQTKEFKELKNKLIKTGKEVLLRMEEVYISQTFNLRQNALLKSLQSHIPSIKADSGKIYVIMGEHHGNPFTSPRPAEVQKIINYLADKYMFLSI